MHQYNADKIKRKNSSVPRNEKKCMKGASHDPIF